jgi:hypothetical protein
MPWGEIVRYFRLDRLGDIKRTVAAHCDGVGYTDGVELPAEHALLFNGSLDDLTEFEYCRMLAV